MNQKILNLFISVGALAFLLSAPVQAASSKAQNHAEMEAKMQEAATPGAEHAVLNALIGEWTVSNRSWMKPGAKVQHSTGTSTNTWVLGERFVKQEYRGNWAGQPFEGLSYLGYDNVKKEYVSVWMDNMSTAMIRSKGQYDSRTKTIEDSGTFSCPINGEVSFRSTWKIVNQNKLIFTMFMQTEGGREFKSTEITYKRVK